MLNPAPPRPELNLAILKSIDVLIPNQDEAEQLVGMAIDGIKQAGVVAARLIELGPKCVVITLGALGCVITTGTSAPIHVPAHRALAVDTVGAGDIFCGAFAASYARDADVERAAAFALAASAIKIRSSGAQAGVPEKAEIEALVKSDPRSRSTI